MDRDLHDAGEARGMSANSFAMLHALAFGAGAAVVLASGLIVTAMVFRANRGGESALLGIPGCLLAGVMGASSMCEVLERAAASRPSASLRPRYRRAAALGAANGLVWVLAGHLPFAAFRDSIEAAGAAHPAVVAFACLLGPFCLCFATAWAAGSLSLTLILDQPLRLVPLRR